jgi:hypothetical protein
VPGDRGVREGRGRRGGEGNPEWSRLTTLGLKVARPWVGVVRGVPHGACIAGKGSYVPLHLIFFVEMCIIDLYKEYYMITKKRRQHYVWKHYLEPWTTNKKIVCMRNDKVFTTALENIAQEKDFYRLNELTSDELIFLQEFFNDLPTPLKILADNWIKIFNYVFDVKNAFSNAKLSKNPDKDFDVLINNAEEELQSKYENIGDKYLNMLRTEKTDFYKDDQSNCEFTTYLTMQYFRTVNMQNKMIVNKEKYKTIRIDKMWNIMRNVFATNVAGNIFIDKENWELVPLKNNAVIPFITGDQPVINLYGKEGEKTEKLIFYYPIKPDFSVLLKKKNENYRPILNEVDVIFYNDKIVHYSNMEIFSNSLQIKKFISEGK